MCYTLAHVHRYRAQPQLPTRDPSPRQLPARQKIVKRTLANLSDWPAPRIDLLRRVLKDEALLPAAEALAIERSLPHGHVAAVLGTVRRLGLEAMVARTPCPERDVVMALIVARVLSPASKLATARGLDEQTAISSLGSVLELEGIDENRLYEAMDWIYERQEKIEKGLARRHLEEGSLVLYDVSSTYFEGRCCPLARFGHSRDEKPGNLQIVFGLLTNRRGCPVAVEVFAGNTGDPKTVAGQVKQLRQRFGLKHLVLVGDRGMLTTARIREDLRGEEGLEWITALRASQIQKLVSDGALQLSFFDERDLAEITHPAYGGERLLACRNPLLAEERRRKRKELLEATEKELAKIAASTERKRRPLRGHQEIGLRVGKILGRYKMGKHFQLYIEDASFRWERKAESIAREAALDGIYVIRTSVSTAAMSSQEVVGHYKGLAEVERAFRSLKSVDLKVRPIYHHQPDRVRAHVFLCMLAIMWNGTCAKRWRRCCLTTTIEKARRNSAPVWWLSRNAH